MKTRASIVAHVSLFVAGFTLLGIGGCASLDSSKQESMFTVAGFRARLPTTKEQKKLYAALPAYKMQRGSAKGKTYYAYRDEKQGVAYVGSEAEYQRYKQLAIHNRIASKNYQVTQMNNDLAGRWYGAWGPYYFWY